MFPSQQQFFFKLKYFTFFSCGLVVFLNSGFKRTLCGSQWNTLIGHWSTPGKRGSSTARYGCCPANKFMSSPEGTGTFVETDSCSACSAISSPATFVPNDEIRCFYDKMPDGCKGKDSHDRSCYPRQAVDELIAVNADGSGTHATYGPMKDWDMSEVTDFQYLFFTKGTMNADLSSWDVSRVTNMFRST